MQSGEAVKARLFGLVCLALAAGAAWWGIWQPLQDAAAQAPHVRYSLEVFVLVPAAAIFGLFFVLFGDTVAYRDAGRQSFTLAGWLLMAAVLAGSGAGFWWFKQHFVDLGYAYSGADPQPAASFAPAPIPSPPRIGR